MLLIMPCLLSGTFLKWPRGGVGRHFMPSWRSKRPNDPLEKSVVSLNRFTYPEWTELNCFIRTDSKVHPKIGADHTSRISGGGIHSVKTASAYEEKMVHKNDLIEPTIKKDEGTFWDCLGFEVARHAWQLVKQLDRY